MHEIIIPTVIGIVLTSGGLWYNIYMIKKTKLKEKIITKKEVAKKVVENKVSPKVVVKAKGATFNKYGTCIDCQNGDPNCLHNNLVQDGRCVKCVTCGKCFPQ